LCVDQRQEYDTPAGPRLAWGVVEYPQPLSPERAWKFSLLPLDPIEWARHRFYQETEGNEIRASVEEAYFKEEYRQIRNAADPRFREITMKSHPLLIAAKILVELEERGQSDGQS
jgi:hypothetical protein